MVSAAIVDDYPVMRELLREFLRRADFQVVGEAGSAREVLDNYKGWDPDITIVDVLLPDASGIDLTKQIVEMDPEAKILIVTGLETDKDLVDGCRAAGARGFLAKPFTSADLIGAIKRL